MPLSFADAACDSGFTEHNSRCYKMWSAVSEGYHQNLASWTCKKNGATLASISNESENNFLYKL